jgi:hypothetical protein
MARNGDLWQGADVTVRHELGRTDRATARSPDQRRSRPRRTECSVDDALLASPRDAYEIADSEPA